MVILGVFLAIIPECLELWQVYISNFLSSMAGGVWDAGNSVWTIELWGKRASVFLQLNVMCYGLGNIFSPILVKPYLYGDLNKTESSDSSNPTTTEVALLASTYSTTNYSIEEDINYSVDRRASLRTPFLAVGCITLLGM